MAKAGRSTHPDYVYISDSKGNIVLFHTDNAKTVRDAIERRSVGSSNTYTKVPNGKVAKEWLSSDIRIESSIQGGKGVTHQILLSNAEARDVVRQLDEMALKRARIDEGYRKL